MLPGFAVLSCFFLGVHTHATTIRASTRISITMKPPIIIRFVELLNTVEPTVNASVKELP